MLQPSCWSFLWVLGHLHASSDVQTVLSSGQLPQVNYPWVIKKKKTQVLTFCALWKSHASGNSLPTFLPKFEDTHLADSRKTKPLHKEYCRLSPSIHRLMKLMFRTHVFESSDLMTSGREPHFAKASLLM